MLLDPSPCNETGPSQHDQKGHIVVTYTVEILFHLGKHVNLCTSQMWRSQKEHLFNTEGGKGSSPSNTTPPPNRVTQWLGPLLWQ